MLLNILWYCVWGLTNHEQSNIYSIKKIKYSNLRSGLQDWTCFEHILFNVILMKKQFRTESYIYVPSSLYNNKILFSIFKIRCILVYILLMITLVQKPKARWSANNKLSGFCVGSLLFLSWHCLLDERHHICPQQKKTRNLKWKETVSYFKLNWDFPLLVQNEPKTVEWERFKDGIYNADKMFDE